jgi:hypothetical protein
MLIIRKEDKLQNWRISHVVCNLKRKWDLTKMIVYYKVADSQVATSDDELCHVYNITLQGTLNWKKYIYNNNVGIL